MDVVHVTDQLLERFKTLATPTLANALDDVAFEGVLVGLAQMVPGTRAVGRATTVREVTGRRGDFASEDFKKVGDVIDASRHMTPLTGRSRLAVVATNVPVSCGGVRVRPGDVIVADGSGVVCIPAEHAARVAELAEGYNRDDAAAAAELRKGLTFSAAMSKFRRI